MWKETFDVYVEDKHKLGMKEFFDDKSPHAYQDMTARMLETVRKGYWNADTTTQAKLLGEYVESVNKYGASGSEQTSGNPRLMKYVMERGKAVGIPVLALEGFQRAMERAIGGQLVQAAKSAEAFATRNDAREAAATVQANAQMKPGQTIRDGSPAPTPSSTPAAAAAVQLKGYLMEQEERAKAALTERAKATRDSQWDGLLVAIPVLALLVAWSMRRRGPARHTH
jgi:cobaltochelatase CobN